MARPITANDVGAEDSGWRSTRRNDTDRVVRIARRHSLLVRFMRIGLPFGVIVGLTTLVLVTYFKPMQIFDKLPGVSGNLGIQGSKITMQLPKIAGFTRDSRAYELTAENAIQDIASPDMIELQNLRAKMEMQDKDVVNLSAKAGTYNTKGDKIVLRDQIVVTSGQGYSARLREAAVDMKQGHVVSDQPVEVTLPNGLLTSNGMEIIESGAVIRFNRGVVLTLDPAKTSEAAK
ncbi:MAG: lipopolysaccharide export system protein LptC [Hyphomicrobiales bacterium]|jgi:lipopolysaccharide export system protein LptC